MTLHPNCPVKFTLKSYGNDYEIQLKHYLGQTKIVLIMGIKYKFRLQASGPPH